ncbi:MAG TPA: hypothetical protein PL004_00970 [Bacillota bacterium]|nr:hypothetical protein [Bacillota bacterium]
MKKWIVALLVATLSLLAITAFAAENVVEVIPDGWDSPVKDVLSSNGIVLESVSIKEKTSYTFYVWIPKGLSLENEAYFTKLVQDVASAHKFQSFRMEDTSNEIFIDVDCKAGKINSVVYNNNKNYFADLKALKEKEKQFAAAIMKAVPELNELAKEVERRQAKLVIRMEREPLADGADKYEKDFYLMVIAQDKDGVEFYIDECLISKDGKTIVWYDASSDKYVTAAEWNEKMKAKPWTLE